LFVVFSTCQTYEEQRSKSGAGAIRVPVSLRRVDGSLEFFSSRANKKPKCGMFTAIPLPDDAATPDSILQPDATPVVPGSEASVASAASSRSSADAAPMSATDALEVIDGPDASAAASSALLPAIVTPESYRNVVKPARAHMSMSERREAIDMAMIEAFSSMKHSRFGFSSGRDGSGEDDGSVDGGGGDGSVVALKKVTATSLLVTLRKRVSGDDLALVMDCVAQLADSSKRFVLDELLVDGEEGTRTDVDTLTLVRELVTRWRQSH
jgi:hypothetical protein